MGVTQCEVKFCFVILALGGCAWGFGVSKTWKRLGQTNGGEKLSSNIALEDLPPPYCSITPPSTSDYFMMYFFDLANVVEKGELSRVDGVSGEEP